MLADHELTTSTLAARVAASVRPPAYDALAAGLSTLAGRLHGAAAGEVVGLLVDARTVGAAAAIDRILDASQPVPGFGHSIYKRRDPRVAPLLDARGSSGFCEDLLEEQNLAVVPGSAFGVDDSIRLSYATSLETIERALARLAAFVARKKSPSKAAR